METILKVENLRKNYPDFSLKSLNFGLEKGTITGFVGPNGSGKTTTIKCILNLLHTDSGRITAMGLDPVKNEQKLKDMLGIVLDEGYFYDELTLREMKSLIAPLYTQWDEGTYRSTIRQFGLPENKKIKELSKGMRMKYSIVLAMSHNARLFIMDEPTSGLDPLVRRELMEILKTLIQDEEKSIFFSTHITSDLDKIADYLIFIHDGQIILQGGKDELKDQHAIVKGKKDQLTPGLEACFVGISRSPYGFEGLTNDRTAVRRQLKDGVVYEVPTVEDLMLYYTRRGL